MSRDWENWDVSGIASEIQTIWLSSDEENAHREQLADLVCGRIPASDPSILEVGCGTGLVYEKLAAKHKLITNYIGIDSSLKMLEIARRNFPRGQFLYGDGYELVFRDQEFDAVLSFEVLGHIPRIKPFLSEMLRVAKKTCIFTTWPSDSSDVVEDYETIDGTRFLYRRYSESYIQKLIYIAGRQKLDDIELIPLNSGGQAYVVTLHP
ncbi:class I SAM-dependent methyltransferase [Mesorhizobium sp. VK9D]|uniref:class I SAM-dependent methyltransferase n=1 Tax=Mesorhizobium australafricanum TaxID=3072311 RepID=UPI002A23E74B|nr:class I SAM-dependent methyltransferase [Mesorhizobium sp. VK9D]MDX8451974.1 class I SAM-dependent methyltransferase [Mesorhizobium sp. VK9D]